MAGQYRFKDQSGNIVAQISASVGGAIAFSGSVVDFTQANNVILGNVQLAGTASNALLLDGFDSQAFAFTSSIHPFTASIAGTNTFTSSASARLNSIETISASNVSRLNAVETITASNIARLNAIETITSSNLARLNALEIKTGSLATTGSNTFIGTQTITGSLYISSDLIVQGSSSLQNITASAVSIGTNIINLNTANPAIRYAGLSIGDSGSIGSSGSFLYDSVQDEMIFVHRGANTTVTSSVVLMGPQTFDNIGGETYPTNNLIQKGTGNEHLADSCIYHDSNTTCFYGNAMIISSSCQIIFGNAPADFAFNVGTTCIGTNASIAQFFNNDYTVGTRGFIRVRNSANISGTTSAYFGQGQDQKMYFYNNDPSRLGDIVITNTGKVGIGTPSPIAQLHIKTDVASESRPTTLATSATNSAVYITTICGSNAGIAFGQLGANSNYIQSTYQDGSACTPLILNPYSGNVGIGTGNTAPAGILEIKGTNTYNKLATCFFGLYSSGFAFSDYNSGITYDAGVNIMCLYSNYTGYGGIVLSTCGSPRVFVNVNGNVGMGTNIPDAKLHICNAIAAGTNNYLIIVQNACTVSDARAGIAFSNNGQTPSAGGLSGASIQTSNNGIDGAGNLLFSTLISGTNCERMRITSAGRVGIQNSSPQGKLEVGIACSNTTAGGHFFSTFQIPVNTWYTVFTSPSNGQWNAVTEFTWTSAGDFNRSGAAYMRWAYEPGAATLGVVYTLFNNSQNATATFRKSGADIQINITGGAADYYTQVRIQGSQAS